MEAISFLVGNLYAIPTLHKGDVQQSAWERDSRMLYKFDVNVS